MPTAALLRLGLSEESADARGARRGLLDMGEVPGPIDRLEPRSRNGAAIGCAVVRRGDEPIVGAPQEQRGRGDPVQPLPDLGVVKVWLPGVQGRRLAIARDHGQLVVREFRVVDGGAGGIAKMSGMSRVSRSPTLMPSGATRTSPPRRSLLFTAISAATQPPSDDPITTTSRRFR